jgi:hypothetical protein
MFGIKNVMTVSDSIDSVSRALEKYFVPHFLGFGHLSREQCINQHGREIFRTIFEAEDDALFLTLDGTYLFTDKSADFDDQKSTWSEQKKRNLVKPMMIILESGYVLDCPGPYFGTFY